MYCDIVCGVLAVGVSYYTIEVRVKREGTPTVRPEEETSLVVVVGMEIVPEDGRSEEYRGQLLDGGEGDRLGDDLWTWGQTNGGEVCKSKVSNSHTHTHTHRST